MKYLFSNFPKFSKSLVYFLNRLNGLVYVPEFLVFISQSPLILPRPSPPLILPRPSPAIYFKHFSISYSTEQFYLSANLIKILNPG